jgi:hypothetical protein
MLYQSAVDGSSSCVTGETAEEFDEMKKMCVMVKIEEILGRDGSKMEL